MQAQAPLIHGAALRLAHQVLRKRPGRLRGVTDPVIPVYNLGCHSGHLEELIVMGVGGNEAAPDGALQKENDHQAVGRGHIIVYQPQAVHGPEGHSRSQHQGGKLLGGLSSRHPALHQKHDHKIDAHPHYPGHNDKVENLIMINVIVERDSPGEGKHPLVQVVGKHADNKQKGGKVQHPLPAGGIVLPLSHAVNDEDAHQGDEDDGNVKSVPAQPLHGMSGGHKDPLAGADSEPEGHEKARRQKVPLHRRVENALPEGDAPAQKQAHMDGVPEQGEDTFQQAGLHPRHKLDLAHQIGGKNQKNHSGCFPQPFPLLPGHGIPPFPRLHVSVCLLYCIHPINATHEAAGNRGIEIITKFLLVSGWDFQFKQHFDIDLKIWYYIGNSV